MCGGGFFLSTEVALDLLRDFEELAGREFRFAEDDTIQESVF
jgi:hypothetical protein